MRNGSVAGINIINGGMAETTDGKPNRTGTRIITITITTTTNTDRLPEADGRTEYKSDRPLYFSLPKVKPAMGCFGALMPPVDLPITVCRGWVQYAVVVRAHGAKREKPLCRRLLL